MSTLKWIGKWRCNYCLARKELYYYTLLSIWATGQTKVCLCYCKKKTDAALASVSCRYFRGPPTDLIMCVPCYRGFDGKKCPITDRSQQHLQPDSFPPTLFRQR